MSTIGHTPLVELRRVNPNPRVRILPRDMDSGTIVTIICDRGDRGLSTMLFPSVCAKCPP